VIEGSDVTCSQDPPDAYGDILAKQNLDHEPQWYEFDAWYRPPFFVIPAKAGTQGS